MTLRNAFQPRRAGAEAEQEIRRFAWNIAAAIGRKPARSRPGKGSR